MQPLLSFSDVCYSYHTLKGEIPAIRNITFSLQEQEFLALVGPSGCGKSTLLNLIAGLLEPDSGQILYQGKPLSLCSFSTGYMLQKDHLLGWRTGLDNILLGPEIRGVSIAAARKEALKMLEKYQLADYANAFPDQLSGGMRQRVALIRTMINAPSLLLLDEPFFFFFYQKRLDVGNDICQIIRQENKTAILFTHDLAESITLADHVLVLSKAPSHIAFDCLLNFAAPDLTPLDKRSQPEFQTYFNILWRHLHETDG